MNKEQLKDFFRWLEKDNKGAEIQKDKMSPDAIAKLIERYINQNKEDPHDSRPDINHIY